MEKALLNFWNTIIKKTDDSVTFEYNIEKED